MQLEEFLKLTPEEQTAFLTSAADAQRAIDDLTAERDSFRSENELVTKQLNDVKNELKMTKEMNFTLSRQLTNNNAQQDGEAILHDMFKRG